METTTHTRVEARRLEILMTQQQIVKITRRSQEEINQYMFDHAYAWLEHIGCTYDGARLVTNTTEFWQMWKEQWHKRDMLFLNHFDAWDYDAQHINDWYDWFHSFEYNSREADSQNMLVHYYKVIKTLFV